MISYRKSVIILFFKTGWTIDKYLFRSNLRFFSIMWDTTEMLAHPMMLHSGQALVLEQWWTVLTMSWHHYWTNTTDSYISLTSIQRICDKHEDSRSLGHAVHGGTECLRPMELQSICMQDQGCLAMDSMTGSLIFHWIVRYVWVMDVLWGNSPWFKDDYHASQFDDCRLHARTTR